MVFPRQTAGRVSLLLCYYIITAISLHGQTTKTQAPVVYEDQNDFRRVVVKKGDTFSGLLQRVGVSYREIYKISNALKPYFNADTVRPGQKMYYRLSGKNNPIISEFRVDLGQKEARYIAADNVARLTGKTVVKVFSPQILKVGALKKERKTQASLVNELFSWRIEHDKGLQEDDDVMLYSDHYEDEYGQFVKGGLVRYMAVRTGGKVYECYLFEGEYFDPKGVPLKSSLFELPMKVKVSISSPFGWRTHPLTWRRDFHPAVDLRAPLGTPVYAAADGRVVEASFDRWLGKHIIIKHKGGFFSLYAHLGNYADNLKIDGTVVQGQEIGQVGDTGVTTGPHLHFAILRNKEPIDPRKYWSLAAVKPLSKHKKEEFFVLKTATDQEMLEQGISAGRFVAFKPVPSKVVPITEEKESQTDPKSAESVVEDTAQDDAILEQLS